MEPKRPKTPVLIGLAVAVAVTLVAGLAYWTARHTDDDEHAGNGKPGSGGWVGFTPTSNAGAGDEPPAAAGNGPLADVRNAAAADYIGTIEATNQPVSFAADAATGLVSGKVTDGAGTDLGQGTIRTGPGPTTYAAPAITLDGQIDVDAKDVVLTDVTFNTTRGPLTVAGKGLVFQPAQQQGKPPPPERNLGETKVTITNPTSVKIGEGQRWEDAPAELHLREDGRTTLSWAGGTGHVVSPSPNHERITAVQTLGVKADGLAGTITRTPSQGLTIKAEGRLRQAYADGLPRIAARGRVDIKTPPSPVVAGAKGRFTWAPTNTAGYDLVVARIRPGNDHGSWVNLALDQFPMMCGRPTCDRHGGVTEGIGKKGSGGFFAGGAKAINCVILPGTGDQRDITFDVPTGTAPGTYELVIVLEGNFDPITVTVPVLVR